MANEDIYNAIVHPVATLKGAGSFGMNKIIAIVSIVLFFGLGILVYKMVSRKAASRWSNKISVKLISVGIVVAIFASVAYAAKMIMARRGA